MTIYHGYTEPPELTHARWLDRCAQDDEKIAKLEIAKAIEEERKRQPARNAIATLKLIDRLLEEEYSDDDDYAEYQQFTQDLRHGG